MDPFLDEEPSGGSSFDIIGLLRTFWRRKMLFLIPFVICLTMAFVVIKTMTPIYASSGQIMITLNNPRSRLLDDPANQYGGRWNNDINEVAYQEMSLLLFSRDFLEKIVLELGLQNALREGQPAEGIAPLTEEQAIRTARGRLYNMLFLRRDGNRKFRLEVRDPDPGQAYRLAKYVLERFVNEYRVSQTAASTSTRDFLQRQLEIYEAELQQAEKSLGDYQATLASAALADNPINGMNLGNAESNLAALRERYNGPDASELNDLSRSVEIALGARPNLSLYRSDPTVRTTLSELQDLERESRLYVVGSREARDVETRLGQLRVRLRSQIDTMVAGSYPNVGFMDRNQISQFIYFSLYRIALGEAITRLERHINEFRAFTAAQPRQSSRLADLQSDVVRARGLVESIEQEITQYNMNLAANQSEVGIQIRIRHEPELSGVPVEPNKLKLMLMGVVLSVGIGAGLVVLAILLDRSFTSVESIEKTLGVPVIGTLPVIQDDHFAQRRKLRLLRWATIVLGILTVGAVGFLVVYPRLG